MRIALQKAPKRDMAKAAAAVEVPAEMQEFLERITAFIKEKVSEADGAPKLDHSVFFWPRKPWNCIHVPAQHAVVAVAARSVKSCSEELPELQG